jgi:ferrous iron transport protein B
MQDIALVGNPNAGKSTIFNQLTGLNQKVGNFHGVTIDKHSGICQISKDIQIEIVDLPGAYSIYPKSPEEKIVLNTLLGAEKPKMVVVVADASNLKRHFLLYTQIHDLGIPVILALNMIDLAEKRQIFLDIPTLSKKLNTKIIPIQAKKGIGIKELKEAIGETLISLEKQEKSTQKQGFFPYLQVDFWEKDAIQEVKNVFEIENSYTAYQYWQQGENLDFISKENSQKIIQIQEKYLKNTLKNQSKEVNARYEIINNFLENTLKKPKNPYSSYTKSLDKWFLNGFLGYFIFVFVLLMMFQFVFSLAEFPTQLIEALFAGLQQGTKMILPEGAFTDLLVDGILAGLGGVLVFIPQIALLFGALAVLEESGYMARIVFLMDKIMRNFGLNGRSIVPLVSGVGCAVPAIMATRTIDNWKERMITIFVTPLMSCSARLPVYTILIALVIPDVWFFGIFQAKALVLLGLYFLGLIMVLISAFVLNLFIKNTQKSYLFLELPPYQIPIWKNILYVIWEKVTNFVLETGKIILAISVILWVLANYGDTKKIEQAEIQLKTQAKTEKWTKKQTETAISTAKLEYSYAGMFGKTIEPLIKPLGYDWKIGIALLTSFAAREVFVGTLIVIYSVGESEEKEAILRKKLKDEINPETKKPRYTLAVGVSLMIFYAFAMQCMSTMAVVYKETKSYQWTIAQFLYMTTIAYLGAWFAFIFLS